MPELVVDGHSVPFLGAALLGIVVGWLAGLFGIGGGFLMTPLLVTVFRVPLPVAVGTGLCQMIGTSLVSFLRHRSVGQGEPRFDILLLPGSLLGAAVGAKLLTMLEDYGSLRIAGGALPWTKAIVEPCYVLLLLFVGLSYWRHGTGRMEILHVVTSGPLRRVKLGPAIDLPAAGLRGVSSMLIAYIGLGLGFLSGILGIGGGVALNPILIYGFAFPMRQTVGTGIVVLFMTAVVGTGAHAARGHVHLGLAMVLLVGGTLSAQIGALSSRRMSQSTLARIHAVVVFLAAAAVVWDLVRHLVA